jgi:Major Facilitator Superfamily
MNGRTTSPETRAKIPCDISISTRLGFVSFLNDCSSEVIARAMPLFLLSLGATPTFIGLIEGLAETIAIGIKSISGWLSDQMVSRKPLVVCGYALSVLSRIGLLWAHVPVVLGLTRLLDRTGKGLRTAPRDAMIADAAKAGRSGRDFGITRFLDTLGAVTGIATVIILGLENNPMNDESFHIFVWIAIPFALASLVALWFLVPTIPRLTVSKKYLAWHIPKPIRGVLHQHWILCRQRNLCGLLNELRSLLRFYRRRGKSPAG